MKSQFARDYTPPRYKYKRHSFSCFFIFIMLIKAMGRDLSRNIEALLELGQGRLSLNGENHFRPLASQSQNPQALATSFASARFGLYPWDAVGENRQAISLEEKSKIERLIEGTGGYLREFIEFIDVTGKRRGPTRGDIIDDLEGRQFEPGTEFLLFIDTSNMVALEIALRKAEIYKAANALLRITDQHTLSVTLENIQPGVPEALEPHKT